MDISMDIKALETSDIAEHARLALNLFEKYDSLGDSDAIDRLMDVGGFIEMTGTKEQVLKIVELGASQGRYDYCLYIRDGLSFVKLTEGWSENER